MKNTVYYAVLAQRAKKKFYEAVGSLIKTGSYFFKNSDQFPLRYLLDATDNKIGSKRNESNWIDDKDWRCGGRSR